MQMLTDRYNLRDPQTQYMVRDIMANPIKAPQYGVTLAEAFALHNELKRLEQQNAQMPMGNVVQDMQNQVQQLGARQSPQLMSGIANLPTDTFQPDSYAGGGVVAFAEGGDAYTRQMARTPTMFGDIGDFLNYGLRGTGTYPTSFDVEFPVAVDSPLVSQIPKTVPTPIPAVRPAAAQAPTPAPAATPTSAFPATTAARSVQAPVSQGAAARPARASRIAPPTKDDMDLRMESFLQKALEEDDPKRQTELDNQARDAYIKRERAMMAERGIDPDMYKKELLNIAEQGKKAASDKDVDTAFRFAEGFFAMAGGTSPYALKNIADGLGITVKGLRESQKDFREGELARQKAALSIRLAEKASAEGDFAAQEKYTQEARKLRDVSSDRKLTAFSRLYQGKLTSEQTAAYREASLAQRDVGLAQAGAARAQTAAYQESLADARKVAGYNATLGRLTSVLADYTNQEKALQNDPAYMRWSQAKTPEALDKFAATEQGKAFLQRAKDIETGKQETHRRMQEVYSRLESAQGGPSSGFGVSMDAIAAEKKRRGIQ